MHIPVDENRWKSISLYALWNSNQRKKHLLRGFFMWKSDVLYALGILRQSEHKQLSYNCPFIRTVLFIYIHWCLNYYMYTLFSICTLDRVFMHTFSCKYVTYMEFPVFPNSICITIRIY